MSGIDGRFSCPTALTTACAVTRLLAPIGVAHAHVPHEVGVGPVRGDHLGREADVLAQPERVRAPLQVVEQHVLGREVQRPVVALRERVAVVVVRVVDAAPGIRVLQPRAADIRVLLEDDEGHSGLLQPVRGEQPRHARADDQHTEVDIGRDLVLAPAGCTPILAAVRELFFEQREVRTHLRAADRVAA